MNGVYQHCGEKHRHRYVTEFDFRYNNRLRLGMDDVTHSKRFKGIIGNRLTYEGPDLHPEM